MRRSQEEIINLILNTLKDGDEIPASEIARRTGLSQGCVSKYLLFLYAKGKVSYRKIAHIKLWKLNEKVIE